MTNTELDIQTNFRNVFLYWTGKSFSLIEICYQLMRLHSNNGKGYKLHFINDTNLKEYITNIPTYFYNLCPAHQADFVRVNVICDYGGIWLDSDTLVLDSLDGVFEWIKVNDGFFVLENNECLCNGVFGSKSNTKLMTEWKKRMIEILNQKQNQIGWTEIGNQLLEKIKTDNNNCFQNYRILKGLDTIYPVNWDNCVNEYIHKPSDNYKTIIREYQPLLVLVNSVYRSLEHKTVEDIKKSDMPINYFIKRSFQNKENDHYNRIIRSNKFRHELDILNSTLKCALHAHGYEPVLIGNLF